MSLNPAALFCLLFCAPAAAQAYLGVEAGPGGLARADEGRPPAPHLRRFAPLYAVELGSAAAYSLFGSSEPEKELLALGDRGFHRQEIIVLSLLALERGVRLDEAAALAARGLSLSGVCRVYGLDPAPLWRRAAAVRKRLDAAEAALPPEAEESVSSGTPSGFTPAGLP